MQIHTLTAEQVGAIDGNPPALKKMLHQLHTQQSSEFWELRAVIAESHWPVYRDQGFARGVLPNQVYAWPGLHQRTPLVLPRFQPIATDTVLLPDSQARIAVLRFDALHPLLMGNKWFKLLYNLQQMQERGYRRLLTFGGAYSNHLFATAAAGQLLGIPTQAIVRGEPVSNPVLDAARANGMAMAFWSRSAYREKAQALEELRQRFPDAWIIPEGGGNIEGVNGAQQMGAFFPPVEGGQTTKNVFVACGTGSTLAGLITGCESPENYAFHGVAVLKGGDFLVRDIAQWIGEGGSEEGSEGGSQRHGDPGEPGLQHKAVRWRIHTQFHGGGYARCKAPLHAFLSAFRTLNPGFPVEHVYTGKLFWAMDQLLLQDPSLRPESMLALHTGGVYAVS